MTAPTRRGFTVFIRFDPANSKDARLALAGTCDAGANATPEIGSQAALPVSALDYHLTIRERAQTPDELEA